MKLRCLFRSTLILLILFFMAGAQDSLTYRDTIENFQVSCPVGWTVRKYYSGDIRAEVIKNHNTGFQVRVAKGDFQINENYVKRYCDSFISRNNKNGFSFTLIGFKVTRIGYYKGAIIRFAMKKSSGEKGLQKHYLFQPKKGKFFNAHSGTFEKDIDATEKIFDEIAASLVFYFY